MGLKVGLNICVHFFKGTKFRALQEKNANDGKIITRVNLETMQPMDAAKLDRKISDLINELRKEGRF
jgi:hypothetical protein